MLASVTLFVQCERRVSSSLAFSRDFAHCDENRQVDETEAELTVKIAGVLIAHLVGAF